MATIDLNADLAEGGADDQAILNVVSSCNIACGAHAGSLARMRQTAATAINCGVAPGAHPGYPDRAGFGRRSAFLAGEELRKSVLDQIDTLSKVIEELGGSLRHVKAHGALYWDAAADDSIAALLLAAARLAAPSAAIVGPPLSAVQYLAERAGVEFLAEAFVDRVYRADGTLVPRAEPGAVHTNLNTITTQALRLARDGEVTAQDGAVISIAARTLCVHGDTPEAGLAAQAVRDVLQASGVIIRAAC